MTADVIRIVIADDQALVRAGLRLILTAEADFDVVGESADGADAVAVVERHRPHVVLMDVRMPGTDGITATRAITAAGSATAVLVLTTFEDDDVLWGAVEAGAAGFLLKDTPADDLVAAIRVTSDGGSWLDPRVTPRLLARLRTRAPQEIPGLDQLTPREAEVLALMAQGRTNQEIADALYLGERTVKTHVGNVFAKLRTRDRAAAIIIAFRAGLVDPGSG
jgi:DNA-binding NarL/FixJ family response regulator